MKKTVFGLLLVVGLGGCLGSNLSNKHMAKEGHLAPPISTVNADGQMMRLAEHKGKVVLLSFWKTDCPPCRAMFDHEKALVKRYADQPFVLLGVNGDASPFELKRTQDKAGLTWASWWDGPGGSVSEVWGVQYFPTFYLIDQQGVVRWTHVGAPPPGELDKQVEKLMAPPGDGKKAKS